MPDKRAVLIVVDGMGDRPLIDHDYKTPLEYANTPNMDRLAKGGLVGSLDPISPGVRPGSDVANLALLGYDPARYYTGRGALEALGAGIDLRPNDVAFRLNFATVDDEFRVEDRRAGRIRKGVSKLAKSVSEIKVESTPGVRTIFKPTVDHRAVLVLRGEKLSRNVTDTDPGEEGLKLVISRATDGSEEARRTSAAVNEFVKRSHEALREHPLNQERANDGEKPANIILTRGAGTRPSLPSFKSMFDLRGACISGTALVKGIANAAGIDVIDEVDIGANYVALASDHATPVGYGFHTGDPVPVVIAGPDVPASRVLKLSEASASRGNLGRLRGLDLMPILTDLVGRSRLYGS